MTEPMPSYEISCLDWTQAKPLAQAIRREVFIVEQNVPESEEWDKWDDFAVHVLAIQNGEPVGTGRLTREGKIGRMAVKQPHRKQGIGAAMMRALLEEAIARNLPELSLHAQTHAEHFYQQFGFVSSGETFMEAGIEHILMKRVLQPAAPSDEDSIDHTHTSDDNSTEHTAETNADESQKTPTIQTIRMENWEAVQIQFNHILARTDARLDVLFLDLNPELFDTQTLREEIIRIAKSNRNAHIRCLVEHQADLVQKSHVFIELIKRLSCCELRVIEDNTKATHGLVLSDYSDYIYLDEYRTPIGIAEQEQRLKVMNHRAHFDQLWQAAKQHPDFRTLFI